MRNISRSSKKKIIIAVCVLLVIAIVATCIGIGAKSASKEKVSLYTISSGGISESVGATGKVSSGTTKSYSVAAIATVKEVFVQTGDTVAKGDTLATFDTTELDSQITKLKQSYNQAKADYNKAVADQKQSEKDLAAMDAEIKALEKSIADKRKSVSNEMNSQADAVSKLISAFENAFGNVSDDEETVNKITQIVMNTIAEEIKKGNASPDGIASSIEKALNEAVKNGEIDAAKLNQDITAIVNLIREQLNGFDWSSIDTNIENNAAVQLASDELRLAALTAQREIYGAAGSIDLVSTRKDIMDSTKSALEMLEKSSQELKTGWVAEFDGTITSCDIKAGDQTSALTPGITLQNTNQIVVTISIGEYDINKINVGMPAQISTAYGNYTGTVVFKAPTATGGSEGSILDSLGSMAGVGGLSSLTDKGAGVQVVVAVDNPDENIIIGFNADVEIETGDFEDIITVPVQSVIRDKNGSYVYLYDDEEKSVTKTAVEIGATSASDYQILSGLKLGDRIIEAPEQTYEDDTFDVKVTQ